MKASSDQVHQKKAAASFVTYARVIERGKEKTYVFYPNAQLSVVSFLILFNCGVFTGICYFLNDMVFSLPIIVFSAAAVATSLIMLVKSLRKIAIDKSLGRIWISGGMSTDIIPAEALTGISSYLQDGLVSGRRRPKKTFYLNLANGSKIPLNVGFRPDHRLTEAFEGIVKELSADFGIAYVVVRSD